MVNEKTGEQGRARLRALLPLFAALVVAAIVLWLLVRPGRDELATNDPPAAASRTEPGRAHPAGQGATVSDGGVGRPSSRRTVAPIRMSAATVTVDRASIHGSMEGRVLSWVDSAPVAGAELLFEHGSATRAVRTDAEGRFRYEAQAAGPHTLAIVTADGFLPWAPEWGHSPIRFEARAARRIGDVIVYLVPAIEYLGVVTDARDRPVPGARARVLGNFAGEQALVPLAETHVSDREGHFTFHAPDDAVVEAHHPDHGRARAVVDFAAQVSHRVLLRLGTADAGMTADQQIAGLVIDATDQPVADALVRAFADRAEEPGPETPARATAQGATEPDGTFTLRGLDHGPHTVIVTAAGHRTETREGIASGTRHLVVQLGSELRIRGRVLDGNSDTPVPAFSVAAQRVVGAIERQTAAVLSVYDADGRFEIGGLGRGTHEVIVTAHGRAPAHTEAITLGAGAREPAEITVRLGRGGSISGDVVTGDGSPIEGARVSVEGYLGDGSSAVPLVQSALTDVRGRFSLGGIAAGQRSVTVAAAGHHGRILSGLAVIAGRDHGVHVELTPTRRGEEPGLELFGIGAVLRAEGDAIVIRGLVEGGGAAEVGLVEGDAIVAIDGVLASGLGFDGAIQRIRGPEGSSVRLRLRRLDGRVEDVAVPRRRIRA